MLNLAHLAMAKRRWHVPAEYRKTGARKGNAQTCKDTYSEQINRLSQKDSDSNRWLQRIIPDLIINALHLEHFKKGAHARFGDATTHGDLKALAPWQAYSEPPSMAFGASVQKSADKVHGG